MVRRLLFVILAALAAVTTGASPAAAHTGFDSSEPAADAIVEAPVETVTLEFTGPAEPTGAGFRALDAGGEIRTPTEATSIDGSTWSLRFDPPLDVGVVGIRWLVKAPDAHPIEGGFSFTVSGPPEPVTADVTGQLPPWGSGVPGTPTDMADRAELAAFLDTTEDPGAAARRLGAAARLVTLVGTLVGVGALVFVATVLRGDRRDVRHVLHRVRTAGVVVLVGVTLEVVAQIALESGGDWSALWSLPAVRAAMASSFGAAVVLRVAGGVALATGARADVASAAEVRDPVAAISQLVGAGAVAPPLDQDWGQRSRPVGESPAGSGDHAWLPTAGSSGAAIGAVALVVAHLFDGHTVSSGDRFWTGLADAVHVAAGAIWVGGVLMLTAVLWRRHRRGREPRALQLAMRFSVVATVALVAVGVAGLALTVIVLDSPSELWSTEWGRTLVAKSVFVGLAAAAGGYNHRVLIPQLQHSRGDLDVTHRFRRVLTVESVALVAVLAATALLMGAAS